MESFYSLVEKYRPQLDEILGKDSWDFECKSKYNFDLSEKLDVGDYKIVVYGEIGNDYQAARFSLQPMANCCGICVSTLAEVGLKYRGNGLGTLLNQFRIDVAKELGYGILLCTDVDSNIPQRRILEKNGWKTIYQFLNPRTENKVNISVFELTKGINKA